MSTVSSIHCGSVQIYEVPVGGNKQKSHVAVEKGQFLLGTWQAGLGFLLGTWQTGLGFLLGTWQAGLGFLLGT